jgi:hypothetical protein
MRGALQWLGADSTADTVYGQQGFPRLALLSARPRNRLTFCTPGAQGRLRTPSSPTPAARPREAEKDSARTAHRVRSALLLTWQLPDRNRRAVFPVSRDACLVTKQPAEHAELRHGVRAFLILPLVVASACQRFRLARRWRLATHNRSCQLVRSEFLPIYCPSRLSSRTQMFRKRTG